MESKTTDNLDEICAVCSENIEIYAIGSCDHPVCFKCSTRMRVLCDLIYCPICRADLKKVLFIKKLHKFASILTHHFPIERKHQIYFENSEIHTSYRDLLQHKCPNCPKRPPDKKFHHLKDHMRKEHNLHYCDLCVTHLKVFTSARKCYTRQQLAEHRRKGDPDDRSYKGHPNCQFCDVRYLDNDELVSHLRKDHYFCHFCDADGISNQFYSDYDILRDHFRDEHYLCEDDFCQDVQFTNAFRSEIDLKAHKTKEHTKTMKKAIAKQARTIDIEINYAPRQRGRGTGRGQRMQVVGRDDFEEVQGDFRRGAHGRGPRHRQGYRDRDPPLNSREASETELAIQASLVDSNVSINVVRQEPQESRKENIPAESFNRKTEDFPTLDGRIVEDKPLRGGKKSQEEDFPSLHSSNYNKREKDFPALTSRAANADSDSDAGGASSSARSNTISKKLGRSSNMSVQKDGSNDEDFPTLGGAAGSMSFGRSKLWNSKAASKTNSKPQPSTQKHVRQPVGFKSDKNFPGLKSGPTRQRTEITVPVGMRDEDFPSFSGTENYVSVDAGPKMKMIKSVPQKNDTSFQGVPARSVTNHLTVMTAQSSSLEEDFPSLGGGKPAKQQSNWVQPGKASKPNPKPKLSKSKTPAPAPVFQAPMLSKSKTLAPAPVFQAPKLSKSKTPAPAPVISPRESAETEEDAFVPVSSGKSKNKKKAKKANGKTKESVPAKKEEEEEDEEEMNTSELEVKVPDYSMTEIIGKNKNKGNGRVEKTGGKRQKKEDRASAVSELELQVKDYTGSETEIKEPASLEHDSKTAELNLNFLQHFVEDFPGLATLKDQSNVTREKTVTFDLGEDLEDFPTLGGASVGGSSKPSAPPPGFAKPASSSKPSQPPPGFTSGSSSNRPPPGFTSTPATFKTTLGTLINVDTDSENIAPTTNGHSAPPAVKENLFGCLYIQPADFKERNQQLILDIQGALNRGGGDFGKFKSTSGEFRQGKISAASYYDNCLVLLGEDSFSKIFPELLVLLPDIEKQQDLHAAYNAHSRSKGGDVLKINKGKSKTAWKANTVTSFSSCPTCHQVVAKTDYNTHLSQHEVDEEFPSLGMPSNKRSGMRSWVKAN